ncbi:spore photoproduct lyase family protein, partial [Streptomyces sp. H28]|nr:spore photoproduct lyase family protein [Streptomyces sp. H28]
MDQPTPPGPAPGEPEQQALFGWADTAPAPSPRQPFRDSAQARRMLDIREVYAEPAALDTPRGAQIIAGLPGVRVTEVPGHWRIPSLHGNDGNVSRWVRVKTETLVLGV